MSSSLLIPDQPLLVLPTLACRIGLNEAILLQQMYYLSLRSRHSPWVQKTHDDWCKVFAFWSKSTVRRTFANLRAQHLLIIEVVGIAGGGRESRYRVDHDVVDALSEGVADAVAPVKRSGQCEQTGPVTLTMRSGQIDRTASCNRGKREQQEQTSTKSVRAASARTLTPPSDAVMNVWQAWLDSTGQAPTTLDPKRRRIIERAVASKGTKCIDAVRGWRHSAWHVKRAPMSNQISVLLRDDEQIDTFSALERLHGSGKVADAATGGCPGPTPPAELAELWAAMTERLVEAIPAEQHAIWITPLHIHGEHDGRLVLAAPCHIHNWVGDRYVEALQRAAGGRKVSVVQCDAVMT